MIYTYITIIHIYIYKYSIFRSSTHAWKHLHNRAPSLCFAQFPFVTLHNEIEKSYKCVSCDRLKFEYRTFERLSNVDKAKEYTISHALILGKDCLSSHPPHPHSIGLWWFATVRYSPVCLPNIRYSPLTVAWPLGNVPRGSKLHTLPGHNFGQLRQSEGHVQVNSSWRRISAVSNSSMAFHFENQRLKHFQNVFRLQLEVVWAESL